MVTTRDVLGWNLVEHAPAAVRRKVLLLPDIFCTDLAYADMLADAVMADAGIQLVAANPPGFKGLPVPSGFDFRVESYAALVEELASAEAFDLLVGSGFAGNVLIDVVARGNVPGRVMLVGPYLRRASAPQQTRQLDARGRKPLFGGLAWWSAYRKLPAMFKARLAPTADARLAALVADAHKTSAADARRVMTALFDRLDEAEDLTAQVIDPGVPIWYVRGVDDDVDLHEEARKLLTVAPHVRLNEMAGGRHFLMIDEPQALNTMIRDALKGMPPRSISAEHPAVNGSAD